MRRRRGCQLEILQIAVKLGGALLLASRDRKLRPRKSGSGDIEYIEQELRQLNRSYFGVGSSNLRVFMKVTNCVDLIGYLYGSRVSFDCFLSVWITCFGFVMSTRDIAKRNCTLSQTTYHGSTTHRTVCPVSATGLGDDEQKER